MKTPTQIHQTQTQQQSTGGSQPIILPKKSNQK